MVVICFPILHISFTSLPKNNCYGEEETEGCISICIICLTNHVCQERVGSDDFQLFCDSEALLKCFKMEYKLGHVFFGGNGGGGGRVHGIN